MAFEKRIKQKPSSAVSQSGERRSAIELTKSKIQVNKAMEINRRGLFQKIKDKAISVIVRPKTVITKSK